MSEHKWSRLAEAFDLAAKEHQHQFRKETEIPYVSHLMSVSALVLENGGDEDQAIAGLLHDVIEDIDHSSRIPELKRDIATRFGARVLELVEGCTDGEPDASGEKPAWRPRKEAYIDRLEQKPDELLLVSCCDKLHNARAILTDLVTLGHEVFDRFSGKMDGSIWYYRSLADLFVRKLAGKKGEIAARELQFTVGEIERLCRG